MKISDLNWENKPDGTYLSISKEEATHFAGVDLESLFLTTGYMNADFRRIQQVMEAARGVSEYVGPKFQIFDKRKLEFGILEIKPGSVRLTIRSDHEIKKLVFTVKDIEYLLLMRKVTHGIDWSLISLIINSKKWDETFLIAQNIPPQKGDNARIIEMVKLDKDFKPLMLSDGSVDFRSLDNIIQVKAGQILARRVPPKKGKAGVDIHGNPILAEGGENILLPRGANTSINEDLTELSADCAGYLYRESRNIAVGKLFLVPGDVNFKVGNISYKGDVIIRGNVLPDFKVEATGNIEILGDVDGAFVHSEKGNINIGGGLFGKNKSLIKAGADIKVSLAKECKIEAGGILYFNNSLVDCNIKAYSVLGKSITTVIQSCKIQVFEAVYSAQIGTPSGSATHIEIINKEDAILLAQLNDLVQKKVTLDTQQKGLLRQLKSMKKILEQSDIITERSQDEVKKVYLLYQSSKTKMDLLSRKIASVNEKKTQAKSFKGNIRTKLLHPILQINMLDDSREIKDSLRDVCFYCENKMIYKRADDGTVPSDNSEESKT